MMATARIADAPQRPPMIAPVPARPAVTIPARARRAVSCDAMWPCNAPNRDVRLLPAAPRFRRCRLWLRLRHARRRRRIRCASIGDDGRRTLGLLGEVRNVTLAFVLHRQPSESVLYAVTSDVTASVYFQPSARNASSSAPRKRSTRGVCAL